MTNVKVDRKASFLNLVYPFLFDPDAFGLVVESVEQAAWSINDHPVKVWGPRQTNQEDLLPHVANYLHQHEDKKAPDSDSSDLGSAHLWRMNDSCRTSPQGLGCHDSHQMLLWLRDSTSIPIAFRQIDLVLFSHGVGFLILQVEVLSDSVEDWMNVQAHLRFTRGRRSRNLTLERNTGVGQTAFIVPQPRSPQAAPAAPAAGAEKGFLVKMLLDLVLESTGFGAAGLPIRPAYIPDRFLPYLVVFVDQENEGSAGAATGPNQELRVLLYRLRRLFHSEQQIHPSRENLKLHARHYLNYVHNAWFWFSLEGGGFFALDIPRTSFFRGDLPVHLDDQYFLLLLLALQQRFALTALSDEVARSWNPASHIDVRRQVFRRIRDRLFSFTARGYFCQVMQRENHHRCYRRWQNIFQIARLYEEVRNETKEMHDHLQDQQLRHRERQLSLMALLLSAFIGAPSLVLAFLSINLADVTAGQEGLRWWMALVLVVIGAFLIGGLFSLLWLAVHRSSRNYD